MAQGTFFQAVKQKCRELVEGMNGDTEAAETPLLDWVFAHEAVRDGLARMAALDILGATTVRADRTTMWNKGIVTRAVPEPTQLGQPRRASSPSRALLQGIEDRAFSYLNWKIDDGRLLGDLTPREMLTYVNRHSQRVKSELLRHQWLKLIAAKCPDQERIVREQLTDDHISELRELVIARAPDPEFAEVALAVA